MDKRPVFPELGWCCVLCRRAYSVIYDRCPHCMTESKEPRHDHG